VKHEELDKDLARWVREKRRAKQKISRTMIQRRAETMFKPSDQEFKVRVKVDFNQLNNQSDN
jgi:hypothetical protein